jgi:hypothetical protein
VPPSQVVRLLLGEKELGQVDTLEVDEWVGWLRGRFTPWNSFDEVEDLFAKERETWGVAIDDGAAAFRGVWEEIWRSGVSLVLPDGTRASRDYLLHLPIGDRAGVTWWNQQVERPAPTPIPARDRRLTPVTDPEWRKDVEQALERHGELACTRLRDMNRRWFVIGDASELERVLATATSLTPMGKSDGVSLFAAEFPHRGRDTDRLRAIAKEIAAQRDVRVGCKREGDPELYDCEAFDEPAEVDEWFEEPHDGMWFVGEDSYDPDWKRWPDGNDEFFAWGMRADGTVLPGSF